MRCAIARPAAAANAFDLDRRQQREWRRRERRVLVEPDRRVLGTLRLLAASAAPISGLVVVDGPAGTVALVMPGWRLSLAGVAAPTAWDLDATEAVRHLAAAGRYGSRWWVALDDGSRPAVVLATHVALVRDRGGPRVLPAPPTVEPAGTTGLMADPRPVVGAGRWGV